MRLTVWSSKPVERQLADLLARMDQLESSIDEMGWRQNRQSSDLQRIDQRLTDHTGLRPRKSARLGTPLIASVRRVCSELVRLRGSRVREGTIRAISGRVAKRNTSSSPAWPSFGRQTLQTGVRRCKVLRG